MTPSDPLVQIENLRTYFHTEDQVVRAVDGVSLTIQPAQTLGVVGESGSGKSVTALSIMQLLPPETARIHEGRIAFLGRDLVGLPGPEMRNIRGKDIGMIFQEPMTSLNPVFRVGDQVMEGILVHEEVTPEEARERALELFREVDIPDPERRIDAYPHELSGGQKQRVMIAMALACNPKLLIADEPSTALDVTIQKQILELLRNLRDTRGMSILFITHDLGVIAEIADDVAVMFQGHLVELGGDVLSVFEHPKHPYTRSLLACRPALDTQYRRLPTTQTFMDWHLDADNQLVVVEKPHPDAELEALKHRGRDRLLDPPGEPILEVEDLKVHFPIRKGVFSRVADWVRAVDGISFKVWRGQTLGLVGESGCGKTTAGRAILRLLDGSGAKIEGKVRFEGIDLSELKGSDLRKTRRRMQIVFQDPYSSLNPRMTVGDMIAEPMEVHGIYKTKKERTENVGRLLVEVGLKENHMNRYPHEFSGGQRQRISVARALALDPHFIIQDESVSALDVSVQAQVLNLLKDLQEKHNLAYIFISHDLSVVKFMSDTMAVMKDGKIVEMGPAEAIYENPAEDYTRRLIDAVPKDDLNHLRARRERRLAEIAARPS